MVTISYGSSINPLHATTPSNLLTYEISGKQSMNVQNRSSGVRRCSKENLQYWAKHIASQLETFQVLGYPLFITAETELGVGYYHHRSVRSSVQVAPQKALSSQEIGKFWGSPPKLLEIKIEILAIALKIVKYSPLKHFIEAPILA